MSIVDDGQGSGTMKNARTHSIWRDVTAATADWWRADAPVEADVVVVGAGVAGLGTALCLLGEGREVVVIDRGGIGAGETLRTTAHLASALDDRFASLARHHGKDGARLAAESHAAAIDWIAGIAASGEDACGFAFVPGYLFSRSGELRPLEREAEAASEAGLDAVVLEEGLPDLPTLGPVLRFGRQARVDMGEYLLALARRVRDAGGIFLRGEATTIAGGDRPNVQLRDGQALRARAVVAATNVPVHETGATYLKQAAYRSYAVVGLAPAGSIPDALYWDDEDPYHYVRLRDPRGDEDGQVQVIIGGGDHKTGQDDDPTVYARLQEWARQRFPSLERFTDAWSGQILEPADGLAFIGADPDNENVYLVTGDSGNGITHGTLAGLLIADLIQGRETPWKALYDPARHPLSSAGALLKENANTALQYRDWVAPAADEDEVRALAPGNGTVTRRGLHRVAVYRSADGRLHAHDARCTHLGCVVRWSSEEKSWDCPCHGSRFDAVTGAILNGPASEPLAHFDLDLESADGEDRKARAG